MLFACHHLSSEDLEVCAALVSTVQGQSVALKSLGILHMEDIPPSQANHSPSSRHEDALHLHTS